MNKDKTNFIGSVIALGFIFLILVSVPFSCGIGGFGPTRAINGTVISKHVDAGKDDSHYIVVTDNGTFEVDNGIVLGVWNADEIYGKIEVGRTYSFTVKGKKYTNIFLQEYPYVTGVNIQDVEKK